MACVLKYENLKYFKTDDQYSITSDGFTHFLQCPFDFLDVLFEHNCSEIEDVVV